MNFGNFGNEPLGGSSNGRPPGFGNATGLTRQSSIYSLTFDEFQNTVGGIGKDLGSMNMDELLKNIWSAEDAQTMSTTTTIHCNGPEGGNLLQRQGSLTLPRTISEKKVDDVWKDIAKEFGSSAPQRQQTLREMTLEEFLFRAGVVAQPQSSFGNPNLDPGGIFGSGNNADSGFGINFQQPVGLSDSTNQINMQSTTLPLNVNGLRSSQHTTQAQLVPQRQQPQLMPKQPQPQPAASYVSTMMLPGIGNTGGMTGLGDPGMNNNLIGMAPAGSPATLSSESNGNTCSVSPMPYVFNGGFRGRKSSNAVDKVVERRQRRMIKNRESAARSRARKQAYTMDLEQEIAKLKEENQQLKKKHIEIVVKQINQVQEMTNAQSGPRKRLRRMHTGPW